MAKIERLMGSLLVFGFLAANGVAEVRDIGGIARHHVEAFLRVHGVAVKGNTAAETGRNFRVIPEELKSRSRCNGHPISMSAIRVARTFAPHEKTVKNITWAKCFRQEIVSNRFSN